MVELVRFPDGSSPTEFRAMAREHRDGVRYHSQRLYLLLVLREWLNQQ